MLCHRLKVNPSPLSQVSTGKHNTAGESHVLDHMYTLSIQAANTGSACPICHALCKEQENVKKFIERSIACDHCNSWFHFGCLKMSKQ